MSKLVKVKRVMDTTSPVWRMLFMLNDQEIGHMYMTRHPTILYEVFAAGPVLNVIRGETFTSKRIHTEDAAESWLMGFLTTSVALSENRSPKKLARLRHALYDLQKQAK